jgi:hypothetical protein
MGWIRPTFFKNQMGEPGPPDKQGGSCLKDIGGAVLLGLIIGKALTFIIDVLF